jgi:hypothetical protein
MEYASKKNAKKKTKQACPECDKDIHDPDCAYYQKG